MADLIATVILAVAGAALAIWLLSKVADALMAAIDFMTRNEE